MEKYKKTLSVVLSLAVLLTFTLIPSNSTVLSKVQNGGCADATSIKEVNDNEKLKTLSKVAETKLKKFQKQYSPNTKFNQNPRLVEINKNIWVIYDSNSNKTSFFGVEFDNSTNQAVNNLGLITKEIKGDNTVEVTLTKNDQLEGNFSLNKSDGKIAEGWVLYNGKKMNGTEYQEKYVPTVTPMATQCFKDCLDDAGVPDWVNVLMTTTCSLACLGGVAPCATCLALYAGIYGGAVLACAKECPSP